MAPKTPTELQTGALETPTETQQGLFERWVEAIKTHTQVAFLAFGIGFGASVMPAQQVQAQELLFPVVETSLSEETLEGLCAGNRGELDTDTLVTCFAYDISQYPEADVTLFAQTWNRLTDDQKNSVYGFFAAGMNSQEALKEVTSKNVPLGLHEAIIREATANGADIDFDLPAFEEALVEIQQTGDIWINTLTALIVFAPKTTQTLPLVIKYIQSEEAVAQSEEYVKNMQAVVDALKWAADAASGS